MHSLLIFDLEKGTATKLLGDSENGYTSLYVSKNEKHGLVTSYENSWLVNVDSNEIEVLNSNFGGYVYTIQNDYLVYKDKDNTLYCLDLSSGKKLKIQGNFSTTVQGGGVSPNTVPGTFQLSNSSRDITIDTDSKDIVIYSVSDAGASKYYLFNIQNHKFTDLNDIVKGNLDFASFFR